MRQPLDNQLTFDLGAFAPKPKVDEFDILGVAYFAVTRNGQREIVNTIGEALEKAREREGNTDDYKPA